ncbi:MAG: MarR family transcriptional regulator [Alphaproteobacteria bacterium]|nr:MarR family transcriptional regulator [Alphaproteobacteria bacterium]
MDEVDLTDRAEVQGDFETGLNADDQLELRVWLRLLTCANLIERNVRQNLRETFDTTLPRFDLMAQLDRAPDGLTMGALSRRMMVTNGNVTGLIDRLVTEGLVERRPAPGDRRAQVVRLTRAGKRAFDGMTPAHADWINEMFKGLGRQDMTALLRLLAKLKQSLAEREGQEK